MDVSAPAARSSSTAVAPIVSIVHSSTLRCVSVSSGSIAAPTSAKSFSRGAEYPRRALSIIVEHRQLGQAAEAVGGELSVAEPASDAHALEQVGTTFSGVAEHELGPREVVQRDSEAVLVSDLTRQVDCLREEGNGGLGVVAHVRDRTEIREDHRQTALVSLLAEDRHALLVEGTRTIEVALRDRDTAELCDRTSDLGGVAQFARELESFLPQLLGDVEVA